MTPDARPTAARDDSSPEPGGWPIATPTSASAPTPVDRTELWLGLVRRLTEAFPAWSTWKNTDSAFAGTGDIDSLAPPALWPEIEATFFDWCREQGFGPAISCPHVLMGPHLVAIQPDSPYILQLDVKERVTFRGSTLVDARALLDLAVMDERGFRRARKGADGVFRLLSNGARRGGRMNEEGMRVKRVRELLAADREGAVLAARRFGPAAGALMRGVDAAIEGGWDDAAMRTVERWALLRGLAEPGVAVRRVVFARRWKHGCPVLRIIRENGRLVPDDLEGWLSEVEQNHRIVHTERG